MTLKVDGTNGLLQAYDYQVLTTGFTYTFAAGTQTLIANPAGTLATGTITMPASPVDGMVITVTSTQPITALTVNANTGQTINNGGALGLQAGGSLSYVYNLANTKWQPFNAGLSLGVGQTWTDVKTTPGRAFATTYTNTTGRTIQAVISPSTSTASISMFASINGATAFEFAICALPSGNAQTNQSIIIPAGATYNITQSGGSGSVRYWMELR